MSNKTDLSIYDNSWYKPGKNALIRILWYFTNIALLKNPLFPFNKLKIIMLRIFGSKIGKGVNIKPSVSIKYPWRLEIGDYTWIGENVWIDNLDDVKIGRNCCISQGVMILCGNHNFKKTTFDLITGKITLEDGVWIGAKSIVCPGVTCKTQSVLSVNSVATKDLEEYSVYQGNPAIKIKDRIIE